MQPHPPLPHANSDLRVILTSACASDEMTCKMSLVESYGLTSYSSPAREKLLLCPSIKLSCCPAYEQFKIFKQYHSKVKPYFKMFEQVISKEVELIKDRVGRYLRIGRIRGNVK